MSRYAHVFFDLDHTLWDLRTNARATLGELHAELDLGLSGIEDVQEFIAVYEEINAGLWGRYESGKIDRSVLRVLRFRHTLQRFGVRNDRLAERIGREFIQRCPRRSALNPGVRSLLTHLHGRVRMHVITNGFAEVQHLKLQSGGIRDYFEVVLTSEEAGAPKPDARIFQKALRSAAATIKGSLMVGDDARTDIGGARAYGIDQAHYTTEGTPPDAEATYRFAHFDQLRKILG